MSNVEIGLAALTVAIGLWAHIYHRLEDDREVGVPELGACISGAALAVGMLIAHFYAHGGTPLLVAVAVVCAWAGGLASKQYFTWTDDPKETKCVDE